MKTEKSKCSKKDYEVWKKTRSGLKFDSCISGKTYKSAWTYYKSAGHFISGDYVIIDKKDKQHHYRH